MLASIHQCIGFLLLVQISKLFRDNLCSESTQLHISIRTNKTDWLCLLLCFWGTGENLRRSSKRSQRNQRALLLKFRFNFYYV